MASESGEPGSTRQERRERRKEREKRRVAKHGRSFIRAYANAILKRLKLRRQR